MGDHVNEIKELTEQLTHVEQRIQILQDHDTDTALELKYHREMFDQLLDALRPMYTTFSENIADLVKHREQFYDDQHRELIDELITGIIRVDPKMISSDEHSIFQNLLKFRNAYVDRVVGLVSDTIPRPVGALVREYQTHNVYGALSGDSSDCVSFEQVFPEPLPLAGMQIDKFANTCIKLLIGDIKRERKDRYGYMFLPSRHPKFHKILSTHEGKMIAEEIATADWETTPAGAEITVLAHDSDLSEWHVSLTRFMRLLQDLIPKKIAKLKDDDMSSYMRRNMYTHILLHLNRGFPVIRMNFTIG